MNNQTIAHLNETFGAKSTKKLFQMNILQKARNYSLSVQPTFYYYKDESKKRGLVSFE